MARTGALIIKGELTAEEDLTIEGTFEGSIDLRGHDLVASENSQLDAAVTARIVTVMGRVEGQIVADLVDIGSTAIVRANVMTRQLALADGAQFNGSVNTERARAAVEIARHRSAQQQKGRQGRDDDHP
jgi:cytoskeletal protein CcmA (bactofilin family)